MTKAELKSARAANQARKEAIVAQAKTATDVPKLPLHKGTLLTPAEQAKVVADENAKVTAGGGCCGD